ncbi:DUF3667 domain-containing protein [Maribacter sp. X9]|uniref:DUF3667 domain-containing protein n=1 Tax=Maribacter sp. X9 TaxID=3402159 RepID=UPI003AF3CE68
MENRPTIKTTGRYGLQYRGVKCLNCGHPLDLSDKYCPNCSQANSIKKLTIRDFFEEFFSNVFSYDSKLFQTLAALLLKPGKITKAYISGKRLSYTNPFRFLLSLAIIYFLMMEYNSEFDTWNKFGSENQATAFNIKNELNKIEFENESERKEALAALDSIKFNEFIGNRLSERDSSILSNPKKYFQKIKGNGFFERYGSKLEFFKTVIKKDTAYNFETSVAKYGIPQISENKITYRLAHSLVEIEKRPGTFISTILAKLPFATFFFLPFFSMFIWLVYIRKKYTYTDHLIFSFHNQSLLFILLIVSYLVNAIFNIETDGLFLLIFAFYLYKAMRNFYQQGRVKTIIKYVFLNTIFFILGCIGIIIVIAASVFTY